MENSQQGDVLFHETQWYQPRRLWVLVFGMAAVVWYLAVRRHWHHHSVTDFVFAFWWVAIGLLAPAFLLSYRQITEVRADGIYVRRTPFSREADVVRFSEFYRYQPRVCAPIYSAGGWGIGQGWQGKSYNMGGSHGLELCLVDGGRVLIGSCKMRQLLDALHSQCRAKVYSRSESEQSRAAA